MTTNDPHSAERVRTWAAQQYPSGTPLDQDRRMVAAETEAYLSGRTGRETSELALAAKHAGPIDPTAAQEPTDAALEDAVASMKRQAPGDTPDWPAWVWVRFARAALSARRDEEKRDG